MSKHFLTVLGTGNYQDTIYYCEEGKYKTSFIQEAILQLKISEWKKGDRITVFITEEAKNRNWLNRPYTERELEEANVRGNQLPQIKVGLEEILRESYGDMVQVCMIPVGADEEELWEIFNNIFQVIESEEEIFIDITHALRNIPIQMLAVISYARVIKNVKVNGIYYGAFEVGKFNENKIKEAPIFNLLAFLDILDWSQAANEFIRYGNSDQIVDLYNEQKKRIERRQPELSKVIMELQNITYGLETSRGYFDKNNPGQYRKGKSIYESYQQYNETFTIMEKKDKKQKEIGKQQKTLVKPLTPLFDVIDKKIKIFDVNTNLDLGLAAIQWAIENKKTQQGFTALEETMKTFLCNYYGFPEDKELYRDNICKSACIELYNSLKENKGQLSDDSRKMCYEAWKEKKSKYINESEALVQAEKIFQTIPEEFLDMSHEIGNCRNSMNHFGYSNQGIYSYLDLEKKLEVYYKELQKFMECM